MMSARQFYKNFLRPALLVLLTVTFILEPVILHAQVGNYRRFNKPMEQGSGSESFRQKDMSEQMMEMNMQQGGDLLNQGAMMNQPSAASLMYQVHVLGEVNTPGTYRVMASERLGEVLQRAGGIADRGSERRIEIRRNGKTIKKIDLLKFRLYGKLDHNPYLLDNDVIYIPLKNTAIQVVGAVRRPQAYEIMGKTSALDAINLAGGYSTGVSKNDSVRVIRFKNGEKKLVELKNNDKELRNFYLNSGDVLYVPNVITAGHKFDYDIAKLPGDNVFYPSYEDRVFVLGGVQVPGAYPFNPYYTIHQYISLAGGTTKLSTNKMKILTPDGKKIRVKNVERAGINPGDTILVGERRIPPEGWVNLFMSFASFGLSTTATVITLSNK